MRITKILNRTRRDFFATYTCQCGAVATNSGYDDAYFHEEVVPNMVCKVCNKSELDYTTTPEIRTPRYPEGMQL